MKITLQEIVDKHQLDVSTQLNLSLDQNIFYLLRKEKIPALCFIKFRAEKFGSQFVSAGLSSHSRPCQSITYGEGEDFWSLFGNFAPNENLVQVNLGAAEVVQNGEFYLIVTKSKVVELLFLDHRGDIVRRQLERQPNSKGATKKR